MTQKFLIFFYTRKAKTKIPKLQRDRWDGDGTTKIFPLSAVAVKDASYVVKVGGATQTEVTDYTIDKDTGEGLKKKIFLCLTKFLTLLWEPDHIRMTKICQSIIITRENNESKGRCKNFN